MNMTIEQPYQEWWRERPDEARQPVHIPMRKVPIPTVKYRKMRDKLISRSAVERVFFFFLCEPEGLCRVDQQKN